jgi:hypothetical protein
VDRAISICFTAPTAAHHIIDYFAFKVQQPDQKINHALLLGGGQGIGKDTICEPLKYAVGPWNFEEISPKIICGRFNGYVKSVILRVNEARDLGDLNRFELYEHLKPLTASSPDVVRVDEKHLREYAMFNVCRVVITTNYKTNGIYLPPKIAVITSRGQTRRKRISPKPIGMKYGAGTRTKAALVTS